MKKVHTIGISDCFVTDDRGSVLATHALGSCIAVAIHDPQAQVAGLLHFMLPDSRMDAAKATDQPYMFADTGIPQLFHHAYHLGAMKARLQVSVAGGAQVIQASDSFQIGKRNYMALRKIMWKAGVMVHHEDVGGSEPRTIRIDVDTGRVMISTGRQQRELHPGEQERKDISHAT